MNKLADAILLEVRYQDFLKNPLRSWDRKHFRNGRTRRAWYKWGGYLIA